MLLNSSLDSLRLDADVFLRGRRTAVLQEPLDKGNVAAVVLVDLRGVPLAKAAGADAIIPKGLFLLLWLCGPAVMPILLHIIIEAGRTATIFLASYLLL